MTNTRASSVAYTDTPVRLFALATVLWGVVGMLVGVIIAAQLAWPELNLGIPWLSYGRLRPLHTNAVIFAFGGCALFATVVPRGAADLPDARCSCPVSRCSPSGSGSWSSSRPRSRCRWVTRRARNTPNSSGRSTSRSRSCWVSYAIVFFGTIGTRKVRHIYVANWFFGAFIIAVALLHIVNSAAIPGA